ncbi:MAG: signal peptidase [Acidimicrobiaceae bacterium]|nr:signal peptidase [Acidimicrobiaceae bacterium]
MTAEQSTDVAARLAEDGGTPPEGGGPVTTPSGTHGRRRLRRGGEWFAVLVVAALVAFLVRSFAVETFFVPSGSMTPELLTGDRILVDKLFFTKDIHRGDIVVFKRVPRDPDTQDADLVKRVIGLPGETISSKGQTIYIDGKALKQPWLPNLTNVYSNPGHQGCYQTAYNIPVTHIPAKHYFVMGDCRQISYDSRFWGTVPSSSIVGKVFAVIWRNGHPWLHWF